MSRQENFFYFFLISLSFSQFGGYTEENCGTQLNDFPFVYTTWKSKGQARRWRTAVDMCSRMLDILEICEKHISNELLNAD